MPLRPFSATRAAAVAWSLTLLVITACTRQEEVQSEHPAEPGFAEQAEAVRAGRSEQIRLDRELVGDADLAELAGLEDNLRRINLSRTEITDAGLAQIARMPHLVQLRLASASISDAGLAELVQLKELRHLHLIDAPIGDAGLAHLEQLTWLESLYLDGGSFSDEAMAELATALPRVHLHFDGGHPPAAHAQDDHGREKPAPAKP